MLEIFFLGGGEGLIRVFFWVSILLLLLARKGQAKNSGFLCIMAARNPQSRGQAINRHLFSDREKIGKIAEIASKFGSNYPMYTKYHVMAQYLIFLKEIQFCALETLKKAKLAPRFPVLC